MKAAATLSIFTALTERQIKLNLILSIFSETLKIKHLSSFLSISNFWVLLQRREQKKSLPVIDVCGFFFFLANFIFLFRVIVDASGKGKLWDLSEMKVIRERKSSY